MKGERIIEIEFGSDLMREAFGVRFEVFVDEQGVPRELEMDEFDPCATHLVAIRADRVVGTLRMLDHEGAAKIGRVACALRRAVSVSGLGSWSAPLQSPWSGALPKSSCMPRSRWRVSIGGWATSRKAICSTRPEFRISQCARG